jgi:hypothetical protein
MYQKFVVNPVPLNPVTKDEVCANEAEGSRFDS